VLLACLGPRLPPPLSRCRLSKHLHQTLSNIYPGSFAWLDASQFAASRTPMASAWEHLSCYETTTTKGFHIRLSPRLTLDPCNQCALEHHDPDAPVFRIVLNRLRLEEMLCREACCRKNCEPTDASKRDLWQKKVPPPARLRFLLCFDLCSQHTASLFACRRSFPASLRVILQTCSKALHVYCSQISVIPPHIPASTHSDWTTLQHVSSTRTHYTPICSRSFTIHRAKRVDTARYIPNVLQ
jgi:hypothetical protein